MLIMKLQSILMPQTMAPDMMDKVISSMSQNKTLPTGELEQMDEERCSSMKRGLGSGAGNVTDFIAREQLQSLMTGVESAAQEAATNEAYRCGNDDISFFMNLTGKEGQYDTRGMAAYRASFQKAMNVERNHRMRDAIIADLKKHNSTQPPAMYAVGVAHWLGDDSIVDLLIADGYNVTRAQRDSASSCSSAVSESPESPASYDLIAAGSPSKSQTASQAMEEPSPLLFIAGMVALGSFLTICIGFSIVRVYKTRHERNTDSKGSFTRSFRASTPAAYKASTTLDTGKASKSSPDCQSLILTIHNEETVQDTSL